MIIFSLKKNPKKAQIFEINTKIVEISRSNWVGVGVGPYIRSGNKKHHSREG